VAGVLTLPSAAAATHADGYVYTFEPSTTDSLAWCKSPSGGGACAAITQFASAGPSSRFIGAFGEETILLAGLDYLGAPALLTGQAYLSFDLILLHDWRGNGSDPSQPDFESIFTVVANGATILNTTFSNFESIPQAYPGTHPQASNPAGTGAMTFSTWDPEELVSIYRIDRQFSVRQDPSATCCVDIMIQFSANLGPLFDQYGYYTPKWGLDNVVVSSTPIPEPASGGLLGLGLLALGVRRRRV